MKEGNDMSQNFHPVDVTTDIKEFMLSVESNTTDSNFIMKLTDNSKQVSDFIAGIIAKDCCEYLSINSEYHSNQTYLHKLSRGDLTIQSRSLCKCGAQVPSRKAGKHFLMRFLDYCNVACAHIKNVISTVTNTF